MIIFKKVRAKNFLSVGNNFLEYQLDKVPLTLIKSPNSYGKSVVLDMITFALYKKAYRNVNLPQLVNNINQKDCVSEIYFSIGDVDWKVRRGLAPNVFEIYKNGTLLDQHASAIDQQKWFESNVLKMSYKTFIQISILGSSAYIPFMKLVPADRRDVIEDLLDIKLFSSMNSIVKDKIKEYKESLKILKIKKESFEDKVNMQKDFIREIEKRSQDEIQQKSDSIAEMFVSIESLKDDNTKLSDSITEITRAIKELSEVSEVLKELLSEKTKLTVQAQHVKETYKFFTENDVCPTCSQQIDAEFKKNKQFNSQNELVGLRSSYEQLIAKINSETKRQEQFKQRNDELTKLNQKVSYNNYQITQLQNRIQEIHRQIKKITDDNNNKSTETKKLEDYCSTLETISREIVTTREEVYNYEFVQSLLKDSGVKSHIIEKYLRIINQQVNKYLNLMELYVNFSLDSEFNEQITTPTFEKFSYGNFSEGQKRRVDLALLFTWRYVSSIKNSASTNLLICDEILDGSLDEMGHYAFLKIVRDEMKNSNVFVISHRDGIDHRFDNVIQIEKRGNFTIKSEN